MPPLPGSLGTGTQAPAPLPPFAANQSTNERHASIAFGWIQLGIIRLIIKDIYMIDSILVNKDNSPVSGIQSATLTQQLSSCL